MLVNVSFPDKRLQREIEELVGPSFSLKDRMKMRGVGSPRMILVGGSERILDLVQVNQDITHCNAELRTRGIIVRFRSMLETYAFAIPYHRLSFYQNAESWQFHMDEQFLTAIPERNDRSNRKFLIKLMEQRGKYQAGPNQ